MFYQKTIKKLKAEIANLNSAYEELYRHSQREHERYLYEITEAKKVQVEQKKRYCLPSVALKRCNGKRTVACKLCNALNK